jgi:hypothetical protein
MPHLKKYALYIGESQGATPDGYERMRHGQTYSIKLQNNTAKRCDVEISIDGARIDTWRLFAHQNAELKSPDNCHKRFTFLAIGSQEAGAAQLHAVSRNALGVVKAQFFPEKTPKPLVVNENYSSPKRGCTMGFSAGGTGLSGHTFQQYGTASPIEREDEDKSVTIEVRLIEDDGTANITPLHRHNDRVRTAPPPV